MSATKYDAWFKMYPADLMGNLRFRRCSDEVRATYLDVLALAHTNEPYGFLPAVASATAITGRSERSLRAALLALVGTGLVANPEGDTFVVPQLVRDRQKVLAGVARQGAPSGRSDRPVGPSGLRTQNSEEKRSEEESAAVAAPSSNVKPKRSKPQAVSLDGILDEPEFDGLRALTECQVLEAFWPDWEGFRREIRAPLTAATIREQVRQASAWGPSVWVERARVSIANGWRGVFPDKGEARVKVNGHAGESAHGFAPIPAGYKRPPPL